MNSIWFSLIWKEWREQRLKFALLAAVALMLLTSFWFVGLSEDLVWAAMLLGAFVVPGVCLFVGAGIAAGEQSNRTIAFLQALPAHTRRAAFVKLAMACGLAIAPSALVCAVVSLLDRGRLAQHLGITVPEIYERVVAAGAIALSLIIWMAALGVNRRDEVRAGAIGLLGILLAWTALALFKQPWPPIVDAIAAATPGGVVFAYGKSATLMCVAAASHLLLAGWFIMRFGRVPPSAERVESSTSTLAPIAVVPRKPFGSPLRALLWKQIRETGPLALLGTACILCVATIIARGTYGIAGQAALLHEAVPMVVVAWIMISCLVSMIAGIGLFADELQPQLNAFWRSRPMAIGPWFATKFSSALAMTVLALGTPILLILGGLLWAYGKEAVLAEAPSEPAWALGTNFAAIAASFAMAAAATAWFRRPVAAASASLVAAFVAVRCFDQYAESYQEAIIGLLLGVGLSIWLAWQAIRRDLSVNTN